MELSFQKTLVFFAFILIGFFLKAKFKSKEEVNGIKKIILNLALPCTIFIALLGIKVDSQMLWLPVLAILLNVLLFLVIPFFLPIMGIQKESGEYRSARLLISSFAPGLSCFPFIHEFLGDAYLAKAAMADLGNKIFVLLFLYFIALRWHQKVQSKSSNESFGLKSMFKTLLFEPVNLFIGFALILMFFGYDMQSLPSFVSETLQKLSLIMTPLVLLFIGLSLKLKGKQVFQVLSILGLRAGIALFMVGLIVYVGNINVQADILVLLAFGLCACSFWPYAHIAMIGQLESKIPLKQKTFNGEYAIAILAISFPFSTLLVLAVFNSGTFLTKTPNILFLSIIMITLSLLPSLLKAGYQKLPIHLNRKLESSTANKM